MGTTLTGTTPQDTYDSLIKVTDNGPLSGTAKYLSDGLGNDSALSLSTSAAGIGTSAPAANLHIASASDTGIRIQGGASNLSYIDLADTASGTPAGSIAYNHITNAIVFNGGGTNTELARITSAGNVGIGTNAPANKLVVKSGGYGAVASFLDTADNGFVFKADAFNGFNSIDQTQQLIMNFSSVEKYRFNTDGVFAVGSAIQFPSTQVASANANALDDYEEGTWTMGVSFGGASVGITYGDNTGTYTKIGRQVTVNGYLALSNKGSSTGAASITGLPFTIANNNANYSSPSLRFNNITFTNQFQGVGFINSTTIVLGEITILGTVTDLTNADFADNSSIIVSLTYFV